MKIDFIKTIGFRFLLIYMVFVYVLQIIYLYAFKEQFNELYNGADNSVILAIDFCLIILFTVILLDKAIPRVKRIYLSKNTLFFLKIFWFFMVFMYLVASINFYMNYDMQFRYNFRLRDANFLAKMLVLITPVIYLIVFYIILAYIKTEKISNISKLYLIIILVGTLLSINSSTTFIFILVILLLLLKPNLLLKKINFFNIIVVFILLFMAIAGVVFVGTADKGGVDYALKIFSSYEQIHALFGEMFVRISSSFMSILALENDYSFNFNFKLDAIESVWSTFLNRILILIPFETVNFSDQVLPSINRLNYEIVFKPYLFAAGATPGLIASIFYIPFLPIGVLFISAYTLMIIRAINRYYEGVNHYNIIMLILTLFFFSSFFEAPLSILSIIEPTNFSLMVFVLLSYIRNLWRSLL